MMYVYTLQTGQSLSPVHKCREDYIVCIPSLSTIVETTTVCTNGWHTWLASHQYRPPVHHTDHQSVLEIQHYYVGTLAWKGSHSCISWSSCMVRLWPCPRQHPAKPLTKRFDFTKSSVSSPKVSSSYWSLCRVVPFLELTFVCEATQLLKYFNSEIITFCYDFQRIYWECDALEVHYLRKSTE